MVLSDTTDEIADNIVRVTQGDKFAEMLKFGGVVLFGDILMPPSLPIR
ncbi:MAG: hypothetical protein R3C05_08615 [Pirellulaceae bacterium]